MVKQAIPPSAVPPEPEPTLTALIDLYWPPKGPCLICGGPDTDARHRVMDAIAERVRAGDRAEDVAVDYGVGLLEVAVAILAYTDEANDRCPTCGVNSMNTEDIL